MRPNAVIVSPFLDLILAGAPDELPSQPDLSTCPGYHNSSNAIAGGLLVSRPQQCLMWTGLGDDYVAFRKYHSAYLFSSPDLGYTDYLVVSLSSRYFCRSVSKNLSSILHCIFSLYSIHTAKV